MVMLKMHGLIGKFVQKNMTEYKIIGKCIVHLHKLERIRQALPDEKSSFDYNIVIDVFYINI